MMTSAEIRQSFLDFFKSKRHTIVPSSSLMPDAPNLLFTNAGMNQFVPIFLGQKKPDLNKWAGAIPGSATRAADTQKCIRAGGKHNDLDDVGLDTYHHTFFEMLGNWSFGDYFKKEAIEWAWELVVRAWGFPPERLYATVFCPYLGEPGWEKKWQQELEQVLALAMTSPEFIAPDPNASPFEVADQEAAMHWVKKFQSARLDPKVHIVPGNKKDNFWMMGDTGPCGPCSEIHVDLTPNGDTRGALVNKGDARCIEIWNLVFIQFNAQPRGGDASSPKGGGSAPAADATEASQPLTEYVPLAARHVDTGMGFERVTSIIQGTKGLKEFKKARISNYETDIFRPIFDAMEVISGKMYGSTLPPGDLSTLSAHQSTDIAFRVIADHIRTLSFAIADGIQPSNEGRGYVLRRILRRAVRYGRSFGLHEPFFYKLVDVVADTMGDVFPEIREKKKHVQDVIRGEEEAFNKTLDNGIRHFNGYVAAHIAASLSDPNLSLVEALPSELKFANEVNTDDFSAVIRKAKQIDPAWDVPRAGPLRGDLAFRLYDTYGFPLDLTELMARERGLTVDKAGFNELMEKQKNQSRVNQKKTAIEISQIETKTPTKFVGYDELETEAKVVETVLVKDKTAVILDASPCYAEMGGQVGDTGLISGHGKLWRITSTQKSGNTWLHFIEAESPDSARGAHAPSRVPDRALAVGTDARHRASETRAMARSDAVDEASTGTREARVLPTAEAAVLPAQKTSGTTEAKYSRRNLPHFERPWAKYMVTFSTRERRKLTSPERDLALKSILYAQEHRQYQLYAACVMPDHVHLLFEPQIKATDKDGKTVFWSLSEILQGIKSASAHNINKVLGQTGHVWEEESMDRMIRGQTDLEEKFHYICRNPWDSGVVDVTENYPWLWTPDDFGTRAEARVGAADEASAATREARVLPTAGAAVLPVALPVSGDVVTISVDRERRGAIQRHHTVTHLLHWALHEVVGKEAAQKGSYVGQEKLTFDFNSAPLTPQQVADIEKLVNERILENASVCYVPDVPYSEVKNRKDVMQFFGDKYGDVVRVVQIGGHAQKLDGYSMELCGGTHTRATGEIGLFRIVGESAIAAGVRRIEAIAGLEAYRKATDELALIKSLAGKVNSPVHELEKKIETLLAHQKALEKEVKAAMQRNASNAASELLGSAQTVNGVPLIAHNLGEADGDYLQAIADSLKGRFKGVLVLGGASNGAVSLVTTVSPEFTKQIQAGKIIQQIAPIVGGKGGGKPDNARGGGKDASRLDEALAKAKSLF